MFVGFFLPHRAIPKQSFRASRFGGYQPKRVTDFKKTVALHAKQAARDGGWDGSSGPLGLTLLFRFRCPKSAKKDERSRTRWHIKRPDLDNIEKAVTDGLACLMVDDSQVCSKRSDKVIVKENEEEGILVILETLPPYEEMSHEYEPLADADAQSDGPGGPDEQREEAGDDNL